MATEETPGSLTADDDLAALIVTDLVAAKLISGEAGTKLVPKLTSGKITSYDWKLLLSPAKPPQVKANQ